MIFRIGRTNNFILRFFFFFFYLWLKVPQILLLEIWNNRLCFHKLMGAAWPIRSEEISFWERWFKGDKSDKKYKSQESLTLCLLICLDNLDSHSKNWPSLKLAYYRVRADWLIFDEDYKNIQPFLQAWVIKVLYKSFKYLKNLIYI